MCPGMIYLVVCLLCLYLPVHTRKVLSETNTPPIITGKVVKSAPTIKNGTLSGNITALIMLTTICDNRKQNSVTEFHDFWHGDFKKAMSLSTLGHIHVNSSMSKIITMHIPCMINGTEGIFKGTQFNMTHIPREYMFMYMDMLMAYALEAAGSQAVNTSLYDFLLLKLPNVAYDYLPWIGLGAVNCTPWPCYSWYNSPQLTPALYLHELGHNFGLGHASTRVDEYGDEDCVMGKIAKGTHFNAVHRDILGWDTPFMSVKIVDNDMCSMNVSLSKRGQYVKINKMLYIEKYSDNIAVYLAYPNQSSSLVGRLSKEGDIKAFTLTEHPISEAEWTTKMEVVLTTIDREKDTYNLAFRCHATGNNTVINTVYHYEYINNSGNIKCINMAFALLMAFLVLTFI